MVFENVVRAFRPLVTYRCLCCSSLTLHGRGQDEICPVCFWQDDGQDDHDADEVRGGPNGALSLTMARENYQRCGAANPAMLEHVRPSTRAEWSPLRPLRLDPETIRIVKACLHASADGPFFPDWEFEFLMGVNRETVRAVMQAWPAQTVEPDAFACAIKGSLTWLLFYPHGEGEAWVRYIPVSPDEVRLALDRLQAAGL